MTDRELCRITERLQAAGIRILAADRNLVIIRLSDSEAETVIGKLAEIGCDAGVDSEGAILVTRDRGQLKACKPPA